MRSTTYARLLRVEIHGGYLDGLDSPFASSSTSVIGGKGCGKTTMFEAICFAFGATSLSVKKDSFSLLKQNIGPRGTIRVHFETKHGVQAYVDRKLEDAAPRYFTPDGKPTKISPDAFQIVAYSQDEIEEVGKSRASQLALVDRFADDEIRRLGGDIADVTAKLGENATKLLELESEIAALENAACEARAIEDQLRPLLVGTGQDAAVLAAAREAKGLRARERQAMPAALAALGEVKSGIDAHLVTTKRKLAAVVPSEAAKGANAEVFARVTTELVAVAGTLEDMAARVAKQIDQATAAITAQSEVLGERHAKQDADYDLLQARQDEEQERTDQRTLLQDRHAEVAGAVPALDERTRLHAQLREEGDRLVVRLVELRNERTRVRDRECKAATAQLEPDGVRVELKQDAGVEAYRALLREAFAEITSNQSKWLVDRVVKIPPEELAKIVRAHDTEALMKKAKLEKRNAERASQIISELTPNKRLYAIERVAIDDEAVVTFLHGKVWKDTIKGSPGQRAGAILPILLLQTDWPLLVDQPDDNVDPDFMCHSILPRVAALNGRRQTVFVTHQANVPVLGKAELIVYITSDGASASVHAMGSLEEMIEWLMTKLEGGEEAFDTRRRAYKR